MSWLESAINNQTRNSADIQQTNNVKQTAKATLAKLPTGQFFKGEITDISGKNITLRLENGQTLTAKLQGDYYFNIGEKINFEVKSNNGAIIEIRPVITSKEGADLTALKALQAAMLPVNDKTVALLKSLMQQQLPIDKNTLTNMYKMLVMNNNAEPSTIVKMTQLQIPVTPENIEQFENYKNFQHQISEQVSSLSKELPQILGEICKDGNINMNKFHMQLISFINTSDADAALNPLLTEKTPQNNVLNTLAGENVSNSTQNVLEGTAALEAQGENANTVLNITNSSKSESALPSNILKANLNQVLSEADLQNIAQAFEKTGIDEAKLSLIKNGNITVNDFFAAVKQFVQKGDNLFSLMQNSSYHKLLSQVLEDNFLLKPQDVFEKDNVEQYYSRIKQQTEQITQILEMVGKDFSAASKTAATIADNVDFMNQLNQLFTYVQLPLKMSEQSAHGDLYVFTNKKKLLENDGKVSVLLHLDMTELGVMDIYVELEKNFVKANFCMEDKEKLMFIQENIDRLTSRLTDRGYNVETEFKINEEQKQLFDDFISDKQQIPMRRFSFDVKA